MHHPGQQERLIELAANAELDRVDRWNFREQPRDRSIGVVQALRGEAPFSFFDRQIFVHSTTNTERAEIN